MENTLVISLKWGLLIFGVVSVGITISWVFRRLGFYKRDWIAEAISDTITLFFGIGIYVFLGISKNTFKVLRSNVIVFGWVLLGFMVFCVFAVSIINFFRKREILFIFPNPSSLSSEERLKIEKYLGNLRKARFRVHLYITGAQFQKQSYLDKFNHLIKIISNAKEIHIWSSDNNIEMAFILGSYLYHHYLFRGKNIIVVNDGFHLLGSKNIIDKLLSELEWCGY